MKKGLYILYLILVISVIMELILRVYNPFEFRQKSNSVILPRNRKMIFTNENIPILEKQTIHTKNSLGFRGPEPPVDFDQHYTIFVVGGSATECFFLSDSNCWTNRLCETLKKKDPSIWINNAGFQGHSTYGHNILIKDYLKHFRPDCILMMAGYNEINRYDIHENESVSKNSKKNTAWGWIKRNSELVNIALNIQRSIMADQLFVTDGYADLKKKHDTLELTDAYIDSVIVAQQPLINNYQKRLKNIVDTCLQNNIKLILVTQPILFGSGSDSITGTNLETYKISSNYNGKLIWKILEKYNDVTRIVARENDLQLIDLARKLPKSSLYFYDICHFSNEGSIKVSDLIAEENISIKE